METEITNLSVLENVTSSMNSDTLPAKEIPWLSILLIAYLSGAVVFVEIWFNTNDADYPFGRKDNCRTAITYDIRAED